MSNLNKREKIPPVRALLAACDARGSPRRARRLAPSNLADRRRPQRWRQTPSHYATTCAVAVGLLTPERDPQPCDRDAKSRGRGSAIQTPNRERAAKTPALATPRR